MNTASVLIRLACATLLVSTAASAATFEGVRFDDSIRLGNRELKLNGMGIRAVFVIRGYVAGLYLTERASTMQDIMAMPGPKRIRLRMLREAKSTDFTKALVSGIKKNASPSELESLHDRVVQLESTIESFGTTAKGDTIDLDFEPERGLALSVNGVRKGSVIAGADFFGAVLGIFVGGHPIDARLKKGLLGQ
ncbi:MAG: chalcone isomerase family protein [Rhodoferax sp.]|nr:chalcone isomerase family protein [Rhodoferax sp.]